MVVKLESRGNLQTAEIPIFFYPDKRSDPELTRTYTPPIANIIYSEFKPNRIHFGEISRLAYPSLWPHGLVLSVRKIDSTGMVLKTVGRCSKPEEARQLINGVCHDEFDKFDPLIQENINLLLQEKRPTSRLLSTVEALNTLIQSVNANLDGKMTKEAKIIRSNNSESIMRQTYTDNTIQHIISTVTKNPRQRWYLIPHFTIFPKETDVNNRILSVEQTVTIGELPDESIKILHRLTPHEFLSENTDPNDPKDENFLARRLYRFGNPAALSIAAWVLQTQEGKKLLADTIFKHKKYRPLDAEPADGGIY